MMCVMPRFHGDDLDPPVPSSFVRGEMVRVDVTGSTRPYSSPDPEAG